LLPADSIVVLRYHNFVFQEHITIVHNILKNLKIDKKILYVFNKKDKIDNSINFIRELTEYQPHVVISAHSKNGIQPLIDFLAHWKQT